MGRFNEADNFLVPKDKEDVKAAVFTAHPDDETVWMGGTILSRSDWTWKIFVATHREDDERGAEFRKAVREYNAQCGSERLDFKFLEIMEDTQQADPIDPARVANELNNIGLDEWDVVFTHNIDGEYAHPNHRILGEYFEKRGKDGLNAWHFLCPAIRSPREKKVGEYIESVYLEPSELERKKCIFQLAYTSQHHLWRDFEDLMRFQFCSGLEMFTHYRD